MILVMSSLII